jgi:enediyne biosynthesis protein E4
MVVLDRMLNRLPRRKRLVVVTAGLAALFAMVAAVAAWVAMSPNETYRPGEAIAGLTAALARGLPADYPRVTFVDVTAEANIQFRHFWKERGSQLAEDMGSGAAWGDFDNDGWLDLFVVNISGPIALSPGEQRESPARAALYRNNGDGTFTDVTDEAGVGFRGIGMGAVWADYDNDGWLDLFITAYGENVLYRNNGDGTFSDVTQEAGLAEHRGFWAGACWLDYDRDGQLDLYVTGYVKFMRLPERVTAIDYDLEEPSSINPSTFAPERNLLYRNNGDGTFTEVAAQAGVLGDRGRSLEAACVDFDEDGWPDLYVANDVSDNVLYRNNGDGTFADVSHSARVADYRGAMGLAIGDWNGNEALDIFITHWIAQENSLYNNLRDRISSDPSSAPLEFMDVADRYGLGQVALDYVGWGTAFLDYDNDGKLDLFVVNGHTSQQRQNPRLLVPMRDQLFWNRGPTQGFYDVSSVSGDHFQGLHVGRGAAFADYDNDGDIDVFIVNHDGSGILLRNDGGNRNRWLKVQLEGTRSNRSAIGARLRLVDRRGVQVRQVGAQPSYLSGNSLIEHFGMGDELEADSLIVTWPSGLRQVFTGIESNQTISLVEGQDDR